ncbi:MAG: peptidase [Klenkia sp.]|nr:peptidase [Klenkia sp.]
MGAGARLGGLLVDPALGLPLRARRYTVHRDVAVPLPDGVTLLGDHYRPDVTGEPFAVTTGGRTSRVEVLHDAAHPSRLELPVLPTR